MMTATTSPAGRTEIALHRRVAVLRPDRIDVRPSRAAILGPLSGFLIGIASGLAIWFGMSTLPLWLLAILLIITVIAVPFAGLGTIYALVGAHVVIDRAKQSATWQQGFLGMGVGTTELVPFWKIERLIVEEVGEAAEDLSRTVEEFAQWRVTLLKKSGRRLEIGVVTVARSFSEEGLRRARAVAEAIAALTGAPLELPPTPTSAPAEAPEPTRLPPSERRRRRRGRAAHGR